MIYPLAMGFLVKNLHETGGDPEETISKADLLLHAARTVGQATARFGASGEYGLLIRYEDDGKFLFEISG